MKKKIAIIGYGGMGGWHVNKILDSDVVECVGIYDIKETRRELARERNLFVYNSLDDVLNDTNVELITIATPNDTHADIAIKAMQAGKHVICEKPVCLNSEELQKIYQVSNETNVLFTVHQNRRWDADYLLMKELYDAGKLGHVFRIESRYHGSRGIPGDWRAQKQHGGGMMFDWGVHLIDQVLCMTAGLKVDKVYCQCDYITNKEVDDGFKLDITFENGLTARIEVGTNHFISLPRFYMLGMQGAAKVNGWNSDCEVVICDQWKEENVTPVITNAGLTKTMAPRDAKTTTELIMKKGTSDVHDFYRNFCAAIDGKDAQLITHEQVMRVMRLMEAALYSDFIGLPVDFKDN